MSPALVVFLLAVLVSGCSSAPRPPDLAAEERVIRDLAARWQKALLARDAATQAAMFAPDGVSYHHGQEPLVGPAAILAWETKAATEHPKAVITAATTDIRIAASGDLAVQSGEGRMTGFGLNGEWKVAHDIAVDTGPR